jgi:hypothetical protein
VQVLSVQERIGSTGTVKINKLIDEHCQKGSSGGKEAHKGQYGCHWHDV